MEAYVMVLRPVKATQYLMCYSYRRRGGAVFSTNINILVGDTQMRRYEVKTHSQNGEDGIINHIFSKIHTTNKIAVEFGVSAGGGGLETNTRRLAEEGWSVFWFDYDDASNLPPNCVFTKEFITASNAASAFAQANIPTEFDLLSIDIDSNDYHVRAALNMYSPRVYVIEYNGNYPGHLEYVMPRDDNYKWKLWETNFGASLKSLVKQGDALGYDLVYCESRGVNAFFVRKDINPFPVKTAEEAYVKLWWAR